MKKIGKDIVICDKCDAKFELDYENMSERETDLIQKKFMSFIIPDEGYGSCFDGYDIEFDICERCLIEWFMGFVHNPIYEEKTNTK